MKAKIISIFSVQIFGAIICFAGCKAVIQVDCKECVSVTFEGYGGLSNGDVITVKVKTDSSVLENAGVAALNTEQEITVPG